MFVHEDEDILLITDDGTIIRARAADVRLCGRSTQGVRIMRLAEGSTVVGVCRAEKEEEEPAEVTETGESAEMMETGEAAEKGAETEATEVAEPGETTEATEAAESTEADETAENEEHPAETSD
jgi:DNA gyrase subunit A